MSLSKVFKPSGLLSKHLDKYEQRPQQVRMSKLIKTAIDSGNCAVVEGATGVGKSLAYLAPLILSGKSAIVSTSTKSLQDQLSKKDLPILKKALSIDFNWAVLKGKNNYFCHEHFKANENELKRAISRQEMREILEWADETKDGDVEYYPGDLSVRVKEMITCDSSTVHDRDSPFFDLCFANRARAIAMEAKIVLVNHTLLALNIAIKKKTDGKAKFLPESDVIIIDEAQNFEMYAAMAFSDEINIFSLMHFTGWRIVRDNIPKKEIINLTRAFKRALKKYLPAKGDRGYYMQEKTAKFKGFDSVIKKLDSIVIKIEANPKLQKDEAVRAKLKEVVKEGGNLINRLEMMQVKDRNMLRWAEARDSKYDAIVTLKSVPLDISRILEKFLFKDNVVICTSATLAVNGSFDFFKSQVGIPSISLDLIVESPFDFKKNSLVYISLGEQEKYWEVEQLVKYSKGNAFILFTSYKDMRDVYDKIDIPYPKLIQDRGVSRANLLDKFKETPNAVLFGTKSFWEGIDVRGDKLVLVVIHKIPFDTPTDLVYSSKVERIDEEYGRGKHWMKYTIPCACLKLKQGAGRLIRSKTDIGVIALLDARVNFRSYKKAVLNSLPPAYRTQKLEDVKRFYESKNIS